MTVRLLSKAILIALIFVGCNRAENPAKTASDISKAREKAADRMANAEDAASKDLGNAANDAAKAQYTVALAQAQNNHDVAVQQCEALSGDEQRSCKDKADADLDRATASAKETFSRGR